MALSLVYRHQARLCSRLNSRSENSKKFLYKGDYIDPGNVLRLEDVENAVLFHEYVHENDWAAATVMNTQKIIIHGTEYYPGGVVLLNHKDDSLPIFGEIQKIYVLKDKKFLVVSRLLTLYFEVKLNAFVVSKAFNDTLIILQNIDALIFPHPLSMFKMNDLTCIPLINYEYVQFGA